MLLVLGSGLRRGLKSENQNQRNRAPRTEHGEPLPRREPMYGTAQLS